MYIINCNEDMNYRKCDLIIRNSKITTFEIILYIFDLLVGWLMGVNYIQLRWLVTNVNTLKKLKT